MSRQARAKSASGIYHIMLRGINQQQIFEDDDDNKKFLNILKDCKAISGYKLFAYCLMGNHIHLLLKVEKEELEQIFKRIGARFVYWYNQKYRRQGHLFQDRFKSEPIEDDQYFLAALRYIHQNPIKEQLASNISEYRYSSYNDYLYKQNNAITDVDFALSMINKDEFIKFNNQLNDDICLENNGKEFRISDQEAWEKIRKFSKCNNTIEFQKLDVKNRNEIIKKLREIPLSIRHISRLTGVSKGIVERICER